MPVVLIALRSKVAVYSQPAANGIILGDVAYQHIGIQPDHPAFAPCAAMAWFICSMETALAGLRISPLRS
ncbi:hypothetical protein VC36_13365 [Pseudomonas marginalis]|nr:hypothetical protein VC37_21550 [Pseudomonas marginalis]KJZ59379.1 hypothetical protein VC36_13365 [Pseudomonas marginalis]